MVVFNVLKKYKNYIHVKLYICILQTVNFIKVFVLTCAKGVNIFGKLDDLSVSN